ncbi:MAG: glycoside hydrolase family 3 C-terminal domain-containing protein [Bacteroidaceae bacterium]|nr:glycoside hydrolase family 3 C-terminal domain-containing protein [Bacteroidaceae bacterium]
MNLKSFLTGLIVASLFFAGCKNDQTLPRDRRADDPLMGNEKRITEIISKMTLEEKVNMLHGKHMFTSEGVPSQGIADMVYADGPFGIREEMEPHSWNSLHLTTDSATFFPTGSALAATWSDGMAYQYGIGMAREARLRGKDMILGPAINIQRIPTGGRTYEYLSEDPFLSSVLSIYYTKGVQDNGVAVCVKHFALNNQETNRGSVNVIVSPRAMREIYLPPFEAAIVEGNAFGVMSAYNKINGYWCAENDELLNQILRKDWGFKGMVISDWGGTHSTVGSINAGLNVEMPNQQYLGQALLDSVKSGAVSEKVIDERVREILRVRLAVEPVPEDKANVEMTAKPEQAQIAYEVALQSIVLLKNEGNLLPIDLDKVKTIAVIGDNADKTMATGGVGAGVKALFEVTPLAGLRKSIGDKAKIVYAQGYTSQQARGGFGGFGGGFGGFGRRGGASQAPAAAPKPDDTAARLKDEAVKAAKGADLVLFIGGDNRAHETEGSDRRSMDLPFGQEDVLEAVARVNPNVVFIAVAGAPVDLNRVQACCPAIVQSWFNGTEGGNALADILIGKYSPSGRLPFSYPFKLEDSPAYATGSFPQTDAPVNQDVFVSLVQEDSKAEEMLKGATGRGTALYSEDLLVGYRWFDTKNKPVMYPFGYGLGYSKVDYYGFGLGDGKTEYKDGETIYVGFTMRNTGKYVQYEVPQVYVHRVDSKVEWPYKELKGFRKLIVNPGRELPALISIPVESLKYWDEAKHDWVLEPGKIELLLAHDAGDIVARLECTLK